MIEIVRGSDEKLKLKFKNPDGTIPDLSLYLNIKVKLYRKDTQQTILVAATAPAEGQETIRTAGLPQGEGIIDIKGDLTKNQTIGTVMLQFTEVVEDDDFEGGQRQTIKPAIQAFVLVDKIV